MEYLQLGDVRIPRVVIGTWSWGEGLIGGGGIFGNKTDKVLLREVFVSAMRNGFTLYDTAEIYSDGESERIIGELTDYYNGKVELEKGRRQKVQISTKFMALPFRDSKKQLVSSIEGSLERTKQSSIDIFWLHVPRNYQTLIRELIPYLKSNKIRNVGLSNFNLTQIKDAKRMLEDEGIHLAGVQMHFSLLYQDCLENGLLEWCKDNNIAFFAYMVMEQGALSGKYTKDNLMPKNSLRGKTYNKSLEKIEPLLEFMKKLSEKYEVPQSQIPVVWALEKGAVPIVGVTKQQHVYELTKALDVHMDKEDIWELEKLSSTIQVHKRGFWESKLDGKVM